MRLLVAALVLALAATTAPTIDGGGNRLSETAAGRVASLDRPGGLSTGYTYDELGRPLSATSTRSGSTLLAQAWTYDADGNLLSATDDAGTATFGYDDLDRLVSAAYPGSQAYAWTYDAVGNILTADGPSGSKTFSYDLADRITSGTGVAYDANGSLVTDGSYGGHTFSYDALGRLTGVVATGLATSYTLDGAGNRLSETTDGATTSFDLDLRQPNPTLLSDGVRDYLPGDPAAGFRAEGAWTSTLTDLAGSPLLSVTETGATTTAVRLDPYGLPRTAGPAPAGIGYAGEWTDPTGLVNLRFRAYDPALLRFTGRDTWGGIAIDPGSANRYAYAQGNPLRYTDPSGLSSSRPSSTTRPRASRSRSTSAPWAWPTGGSVPPSATTRSPGAPSNPGSGPWPRSRWRPSPEPASSPGRSCGPAGPRPSHAASSGSPARHGSPTTSSPALGEARSVGELRSAVGDIGAAVRGSRLASEAGELRLGRDAGGAETFYRAMRDEHFCRAKGNGSHPSDRGDIRIAVGGILA